jgi:hypothetical protein
LQRPRAGDTAAADVFFDFFLEEFQKGRFGRCSREAVVFFNGVAFIFFLAEEIRFAAVVYISNAEDPHSNTAVVYLFAEELFSYLAVDYFSAE